MLILASISPFSGSVPRPRLNDVPSGAVRFVGHSSPMSKDRAADLSASATVVDRAAFLGVGGSYPGIFDAELFDDEVGPRRPPHSDLGADNRLNQDSTPS